MIGLLVKLLTDMISFCCGPLSIHSPTRITVLDPHLHGSSRGTLGDLEHPGEHLHEIEKLLFPIGSGVEAGIEIMEGDAYLGEEAGTILALGKINCPHKEITEFVDIIGEILNGAVHIWLLVWIVHSSERHEILGVNEDVAGFDKGFGCHPLSNPHHHLTPFPQTCG